MRGCNEGNIDMDSPMNIIDPTMKYEKSQYTEDLKHPVKKMTIIRTICNYIIYKSKQDSQIGQEVIINSPSMDGVCLVTKDSQLISSDRQNQQGEAD